MLEWIKENIEGIFLYIAMMIILGIIVFIVEYVRSICNKCGRRWAARETGKYNHKERQVEWECKYCGYKEWRKRLPQFTG